MTPRPRTRPRRRRSPLPAVLVLGLLAAALVEIGGGGQAAWAGLPFALAAAAVCRTRAGAVGGTTVVVALSLVAALVGHRAHGQPPIALLVAVAAASAAVLIAVRDRYERERTVLRDLALNDAVTGVANRRSLLMRAEYEIERHRRGGRSFALVMLDLDGFKALNDRFGHAAGDDLLRDVAAGLTQAMRAQDTVARFGGDEFCVLAPETDESGSARLAGRVDQAVRRVSVGMEGVAASVGVAIFPQDGDTIPALMAVADGRLLEVKRARPDRAGRRRAA